MKTTAEMRERLQEIVSRLGEIHDEFSDSALPEERQEEWDSLASEHDDIERDIKKAEERAERVKSFAVSNPGSVERGSTQGAPAFVKSRGNEIYDLGELRMDARDPEHYVELLRDNAMRAVEKARYSGIARKEQAQERAAHFLDTADTEDGDLAKRLLVTGSPVYERAFSKVIRALSTDVLNAEERTALAIGVDANGGYAVPFQLDPSVILTNNGAINPLRQMARIETITGKEWQGVTSAGITVSRDNEAQEVSDDGPTLAQPVVRPTRVAGFVPFSYEVDQDWSALRSEMTRMLADARDREEANSFVLGNGSPPNPNGIVATLSGNTVLAAGAASFAAADVYKLEESLAPRWRTPSAQFLGHKAIYNKVRQFDSAGGAQMWERIGAGQPAELLGYQARETSEMASVLTTGSKILLFGDFQNFLIVDRLGMSVELVPHLFGAAVVGQQARPTGQRGIFAIWRNNSKILVDAAFKLLVTGP